MIKKLKCGCSTWKDKGVIVVSLCDAHKDNYKSVWIALSEA